jgi:uncharacterized repeat protein (TIGR02543 family)
MGIRRTKDKKIGVLILILAMMIGLLPQMTMAVQAEEERYAVLRSDGNIYETNADNTQTDGALIDENTVTHLFAADDVTTIDCYAFYGCKKLTAIDLPAVTTISEGAFLFIESLIEVNIPKVTTIGDSAFCSCIGIETINLPEVTTIGNSAFRECENLIEVNGPKVMTIGIYGFLQCSNLTTIDLPVLTTIGESAFSSNKSLREANMPMVTTIDKFAFSDCIKLETIDLPVVTSLGFHTFSSCTGLTTINMSKITTIERYAFYGCEKLTMVDLLKVTTIFEHAFTNCIELETIELPALASIGDGAFYGCEAFANLTVGETPPSVAAEVFDFCPCTNLTIVGGNTPEVLKAYEDADSSSPQGFWYGWVLSYPLTVNNGIVNEATVSGDYCTGTIVSIVADKIEGQRFISWSVVSGGVTLANATDETTTFTMPGNAVEVRANYETIPVTSITFDANNGTGTMLEQQISEGSPQNLNENKFTRKGYSFKNWKTDKIGSGIAYDNKAEFSAGSVMTDITLYAQWTENTYTISGRVENCNKIMIAGVEIKLMKGDTAIGAVATTNADGTFSFNNVPNGSYDLIISKGDSSVTTSVTIDNADNTLSTAIILPSAKINSVVDVKGDTPQITVGNLDQQLDEKDKEILANGGSVEIKLVAETKDNTVPNANKIVAVAASNGKTIGMFIDLSVLKTSESSTKKMSELPSLIDVFIPLNDALQGKTDYAIYRYHDSAVDTITTIANDQGEKIELVDGGKTIKLSIKKSSTYAIAYDDTTKTRISSSNNPKTGNNRSLVPISATMGLIVLGFGLYIKNKKKQCD